MEIDSVACTIRTPARRCQTVAGLARDVLEHAARSCRRVPAKLVQRFVGTAVSSFLAVCCAHFRLRSIYDAPTHYGFKGLPRQALTDLLWLRDFSYDSPLTAHTLLADVSDRTGWEAELRGPGPPRVAQGYWTPEQGVQ